MDAQGLSVKSQKLGYHVDGDDEKMVSGLSTVLVASIQEAKDRIAQIEFIFCSQLYPNFQSKSKTLHKFYSEARKSLEDQWKQKETELLLQIEEMRLENQRVLEENRLLKDEEAKVKETLEKELLAKKRKIEGLEREIGKKCEEIDEGLELQKNLVEMVQSKASLIGEKERNLKHNEEKTKGLIDRVKILEEEVQKLQDGLRRKNEKMAEEIKLRETLYANHLELISKIGNAEKERKRLLAEIDEMDEEAAGIRRKLRIQIEEAEHWEELHKQLIKQIDVKSSELLEKKKKLDLHEKEKQLLLDKFKCLEEKLNLPHKVRSVTGESFDVVDLYEKAITQIESVTSELQDEKRKRLHITDSYKRLKSQHSYLRDKVGLTSENMLHQNKLENGSDLCKHKSTIIEPGLMLQSPNTSSDTCNTDKVKSEFVEDDLVGLENKTPDTFVAPCDLNKVKEERFEDDRGAKSDPPSSFHHGLKCPTNTKSVSLSGTKRPASSWRQTRSHQSRGVNDLHDDFLDTPLENVRANLNKASNKEDLPEPVQQDVGMDSSDDETQDVNAKSSPQSKQSSIPLASKKKSFKYIEPVRKKAERENLKGVECKQCKKFYDAVLPSDESKDPDKSKQNFRCEHLDGVSRHRYRYVPPMTPEGFWNIGFESEL